MKSLRMTPLQSKTEQSAVAGILAGVHILARGQPELILLLITARLGVLCAVLALALRRGAVAVAGYERASRRTRRWRPRLDAV